MAAIAPDSTYVDVDDIPWQQTRWPGIEIKILMQDETTGMMTSLTRMAPGTTLPDHMHVGIEQSYVLEGALVDREGACTAGNFVWRKAGSRHEAHAPDGCLVLGMFQKPNKFFDEDA
ncbi:MAG: cupin domain-containing protein [Pseudomonadota bacterium]